MEAPGSDKNHRLSIDDMDEYTEEIDRMIEEINNEWNTAVINMPRDEVLERLTRTYRALGWSVYRNNDENFLFLSRPIDGVNASLSVYLPFPWSTDTRLIKDFFYMDPEVNGNNMRIVHPLVDLYGIEKEEEGNEKKYLIDRWGGWLAAGEIHGSGASAEVLEDKDKKEMEKRLSILEREIAKATHMWIEALDDMARRNKNLASAVEQIGEAIRDDNESLASVVEMIRKAIRDDDPGLGRLFNISYNTALGAAMDTLIESYITKDWDTIVDHGDQVIILRFLKNEKGEAYSPQKALIKGRIHKKGKLVAEVRVKFPIPNVVGGSLSSVKIIAPTVDYIEKNENEEDEIIYSRKGIIITETSDSRQRLPSNIPTTVSRLMPGTSLKISCARVGEVNIHMDEERNITINYGLIGFSSFQYTGDPQKGEIAVGANANNDIVLSNPKISGTHCSIMIDYKSGEVVVIDKNSSNGTSVQIFQSRN
jgi:hypothetical protein